jgi:pimeloyl-ACP methyl ester carboxylesterase
MGWGNAVYALAVSAAAFWTVSASAAPKLTLEETMVPAATPGIEIYVRNKRPEGVTSFGPDRTLLFVHGATYPASTAFDLPLGGKSWMDDLAERGFDVYLMDLPGYGRSTRPAAMDQPPEANEPITTTADAAAAVGKVVDTILQKRGLQKLNVMGWSWGTATMATYAQDNAAKVNRLVLYAPLWHLKEPPAIGSASGKIGAYRQVSRDAAKTRWLNGVPEEKKAGLIPAGWFEQWADATFASDPGGAARNPPVLRAPNGVLFDIGRYWGKGQSTWDPAKITVPTLMVLGEWDRDTPPYMAQAVFPMLVNAPWKRFVTIGEGTHTIIMERNRQQLFDVVASFLTEQAPAIGQ